MQDFVVMEDGTELFVGDKVVVQVDESLSVGEVDELCPEKADSCVSLLTGGWFGVSGVMNTGGWKILRKASEEDVNNLPEY